MTTKTKQLTKKPEKQGIYLYSKRRNAPYRHSGHLVVEVLSWEKIKNMVHEADLVARVAAAKARVPGKGPVPEKSANTVPAPVA